MSHKEETKIFLENQRELLISTSKDSYGYLTTTASVAKRNGGFLSHIVYEDYFRRVARSYPDRVTKKRVIEQHEKINIEDIKKEVIEFYSTKDNV